MGVGALSGLPACALDDGQSEDSASLAQAREAIADQSAVITAKASALGAGVVGTVTSAVTAAPGNLPAQYQRFTNGAIVSSESFGAVFLPTAIFDKWLTLTGVTNYFNETVLSVVGLPKADAVTFKGVPAVEFERGQIISTGIAGTPPSQGTVRVVSGEIYERYKTLNDGGTTNLGLPVSDE